MRVIWVGRLSRARWSLKKTSVLGLFWGGEWKRLWWEGQVSLEIERGRFAFWVWHQSVCRVNIVQRSISFTMTCAQKRTQRWHFTNREWWISSIQLACCQAAQRDRKDKICESQNICWQEQKERSRNDRVSLRQWNILPRHPSRAMMQR